MHSETSTKADRDIAWQSLWFVLPGLLLGIFHVQIFAQPLASRDGLGFFFGDLFVLPTHLLLLIPAWFVLRKSDNRALVRRLKIFFDALTLFLVLPAFLILLNSGSYSAILAAMSIVGGILGFGWYLIGPHLRGSNARLEGAEGTESA